MDADDATLLAAAAAGDDAATEALLRRYGPLVVCACRRQLAGADVEDAAQAVFLVLWRRARDRAIAANLPGWLVVTAGHVCATARRAAARRRRHEREVATAGADRGGGMDGEARALLDLALAALPEAEREVVVRRHLLGEAPEAVAIAAGCAVGTVHSRTSRGLERLRAWYVRRGIACTGAALAALLAAEARAAEGSRPPSAEPSAAARRLAGSAGPAPASLIMGTALMLPILIAVLVLVRAASAGEEAPYVTIYDIRSQLWRTWPVLGAPPRAAPGDRDPPVDPAAIDTLYASRTWSGAQEAMARVVRRADPAAVVRAVQPGAPDADLAELAPDPVDWPGLRATLASPSGPRVPGVDGMWLVAVRASPAAQRSLAAAMSAVYRRGGDAVVAELGAGGMATAQALREAVRGLWDRDGRIVPRQAWPVAVGPAQAPVVCIPEERVPGRPVAMAPCAGGTLIAESDLVYWWPDELPLAAARILRQRLDAGPKGRLFMAPSLPAEQAAPGWVVEGEWASAVGEARRQARPPRAVPRQTGPAVAPPPAQGF